MKFDKRNGRSLATHVKQVIDECMVTKEERRAQYRYCSRLYFDGANGGRSKHNLCFPLVDTVSSILFSPADARFTIHPEADETLLWEEPCDFAARKLNREFAKCGVTMAFSQALELALYKGAAFVTLNWQDPQGFEPWIIHPEFFGVLREDINELGRQDAFAHCYYLTPSQFWRSLSGNPRQKEIYDRACASATKPTDGGPYDDSYLNEIILGAPPPGNTTITTTGTPSGAKGAFPLGGPHPRVAPNVNNQLICVYDLWAIDDDQDDWVMIRYVEPGIMVTGEDRLTNPFKPKRTPSSEEAADDRGRFRPPFIKVCPNELPGYFWGRSELSLVDEAQGLINRRVQDIDTIFRLQARPPRSMAMGMGISEEKARVILSTGGLLSSDNPGFKIDNLAPQMPSGAQEILQNYERYFREASGLTNVLTGQGEPGVRAGVQVNSMLRMAGGRLRDRALLVEGQFVELGVIGLEMLRWKEARVFKTREGQDFTLEQLPKDVLVEVDSHSTSPVFASDAINLAFALFKAQAIDAESLLELVQAPNMELLIDKLRAKAKEEKAFMDGLLKEHPEIAEKILTKTGAKH